MQILHKLRITEKPAWDDFLRMIADAIHSPHPLHFPNGVMLTCSSLNFERIFETFIAGINDVDDVMVEWRSFVGIGDSSFANKEDAVTVYDIGAAPMQMIADLPAEYGKRDD